MLTRKAHSSDQSINPKELNRVLELFDRIKMETAQAMLQRWQRDSNYLNAMRVLDKYTDPENSENERRSDNGSRREFDDGAS